METLPLHPVAHDLAHRGEPARDRLEIKSMEISTRTARRHEATDDELELIEMRFRQAMAFLDLEPLFAGGLLDGG
jgi:hypothetical protein